MGSSHPSCHAPPRQNACSKWAYGCRTTPAIHVHRTRRIRCGHGTAPSGGPENPRWRSKEGGPTVLQNQPSSGLRPLHLPCPWTSSKQHACTHHAFTRHQQVPDATSLWQPTQSHLGTLPWNDNPHLTTDILLEGKIRPANWSFHRNPQRCHLPTFGAFFIGREVSNANQIFPSWAERDLLDSMEKKGKGQQEVIVGAMYRGSEEHLALKAGGNEKAQIGVADKGIVNTSEKYTIAHSNHVGLKFIALKWADLKSSKNSTRRPIDLGDTTSEDLNYRPNEERHSDRRRGWALNTAQAASCIISNIRPKQDPEFSF